MDYLREGINLRAMGQMDPLVAWQKDGYEMFEQMMGTIDDEYLRYVMHVGPAVDEQAAAPDLARAQYVAAEDPVMESGAFASVNAGSLEQMAANGDGRVPNGASAQAGGRSNGATNGQEPVNAPITKSATDKLGRNEPCYCGSGKKFKLCHGRG